MARFPTIPHSIVEAHDVTNGVARRARGSVPRRAAQGRRPCPYRTGRTAAVDRGVAQGVPTSHYVVDDDAIDRLIGELDDMDDDEHADVSVEHESGWVLSAFQSGLVV